MGHLVPSFTNLSFVNTHIIKIGHGLVWLVIDWRETRGNEKGFQTQHHQFHTLVLVRSTSVSEQGIDRQKKIIVLFSKLARMLN